MGDPIRVLGPEYKIDIDGDGVFDTLNIHFGKFPAGAKQDSLQIWKARPDGGEDLIRTLNIDPLQVNPDNPYGANQSIVLKVAAGKLPSAAGNGDARSDGQLNDTLYIYPSGN